MRVIRVPELKEARAQLAQCGTEVDLMGVLPAFGQHRHRGLGERSFNAGQGRGEAG